MRYSRDRGFQLHLRALRSTRAAAHAPDCRGGRGIPGRHHKVSHLIDGDVRTEYSSNAKGTTHSLSSISAGRFASAAGIRTETIRQPSSSRIWHLSIRASAGDGQGCACQRTRRRNVSCVVQAGDGTASALADHEAWKWLQHCGRRRDRIPGRRRPRVKPNRHQLGHDSVVRNRPP
jgi:hypothetical protein